MQKAGPTLQLSKQLSSPTTLSVWEPLITLSARFSSLQLKRFTNTSLFCLFCLKIINILSLYHCTVTTLLLSLQIQCLTSNSYGERKRRESRFSKRNEPFGEKCRSWAASPHHREPILYSERRFWDWVVCNSPHMENMNQDMEVWMQSMVLFL